MRIVYIRIITGIVRGITHIYIYVLIHMVDSQKLECGCRVIYSGCPCFLCFGGQSTGIFQL